MNFHPLESCINCPYNLLHSHYFSTLLTLPRSSIDQLLPCKQKNPALARGRSIWINLRVEHCIAGIPLHEPTCFIEVARLESHSQLDNFIYFLLIFTHYDKLAHMRADELTTNLSELLLESHEQLVHLTP